MMNTIARHKYPAVLRRVARHLADCRNGLEAVRWIARWWRNEGGEYGFETSDGDVDCFELAAALYWIGAWNHDGQWSPMYAVLCATEYSPGACESRPDLESMDALLYNEIAAILGIEPCGPPTAEGTGTCADCGEGPVQGFSIDGMRYCADCAAERTED